MYKDATLSAGKPGRQHRLEAPFHLVDLISLSEVFTVGQFLGTARSLIDDIYNRGKTPIIMGCGAHYLHMLLSGAARIPEPEPSALLEVGPLRSR